MSHDRRRFLGMTAALAATAGPLLSSVATHFNRAPARPSPFETSETPMEPKPTFDISLAQWSLHRALRGGKLDNLDFPKLTKEKFDIHAVEYVSTFFKTKAKDPAYLSELKKRCDDLQVKSLLIMVDGEGALGDANEKKRQKAVDNHVKWLDAAAFLGCHSIRVNAQSQGTWEEQRDRAADGLNRLCRVADPMGLNVIVENHGGLSSNGKWLAQTIHQACHLRCGTLPDFGNFRVSKTETYDRYVGVRELLPFAKAVSAKSHEFDDKGVEVHTDFPRMVKMVVEAGYHGFIGIEYEGSKHSEVDGIKLTRDLLKKVRSELGN